MQRSIQAHEAIGKTIKNIGNLATELMVITFTDNTFMVIEAEKPKLETENVEPDYLLPS